jgi:allose kinase
MNGSFHAGKNGVAGELGHIPMIGSRRQCGCGNVGCLETEASGKRLSQIVADDFPGEHVADVFERHGDTGVVVSFLECLSFGLAIEINLLDPDDVVIGGGVTRMKAFPRVDFTRRILSHVRRPMPFEGVSLHFSSADEYGGILGGASLASRLLRNGATA